jgi:predicted DNA-binding protein (MmcQ/YjbR family)
MELVAALRRHCESKAGMQRSNLHDAYNILGGFLGDFARFILDEQPHVLMLRCRDEVRAGLANSVHISERMKWDTTGWQWSDVVLDGSLTEPTLMALIDDSYQIVYDELYDYQKHKASLLTRGLSPRELLAELVSFEGLTRRKEQIESLITSALLLKTERVEEDNLPLGQSKIGGHPDLPAGNEWPTFSDGKPLAFLAQINLAEAVAVSPLPGLPERGLLRCSAGNRRANLIPSCHRANTITAGPAFSGVPMGQSCSVTKPRTGSTHFLLQACDTRRF